MKIIDQHENASERLAAFGWVPSLHEDVTSDRKIAQLSDHRAVGVRFRFIPDVRSILVEDEDGNSTGIRIQAMDEHGLCRILMGDQPGHSVTEDGGSKEEQRLTDIWNAFCSFLNPESHFFREAEGAACPAMEAPVFLSEQDPDG